MGYFDNDGYLYLKGRKDDIINVGGEKVSPTEIELTIKQLDKVQDVGVIGIPDRTFGEIPVAFIVTKVNLETNEILAHCIKTLERYKIPQNFIFIDSVPKNESGKIERSALKEMYTKQWVRLLVFNSEQVIKKPEQIKLRNNTNWCKILNISNLVIPIR